MCERERKVIGLICKLLFIKVRGLSILSNDGEGAVICLRLDNRMEVRSYIVVPTGPVNRPRTGRADPIIIVTY